MADGEAVIELAALPTLCSRWLIPKLPSFLAQHASVSLNCTSRFLPFDFATEPFDAALHFGAPAWPGGVLYRLFDERMVAVCAERFRDAHDLDDEDGLQTAPLLQQSTRPEAWANYFDEGSRARPAAARGARFDQISMLIEAAIAGMGAALLPEFLIENELADGSLVRIGKRTLATQNAYYFVAAEDKAGLAHIVQFRQWLLAQAGRFRAYDEVVPTPPEPSLGA
ncbi:LysR substrate-binding domain-containing protein [Terricaulis sp.]|uniref:LysR substrate-binding domain-containing protein n=1 Tax=Terricaulis sp. TaxID=2768686 RepID=UPI0037835EEF